MFQGSAIWSQQITHQSRYASIEHYKYKYIQWNYGFDGPDLLIG